MLNHYIVLLKVILSVNYYKEKNKHVEGAATSSQAVGEDSRKEQTRESSLLHPSTD